MAEEKLVKVEGLKRTYGKGGKYYGPGDAEMPESLARSLGLLDDKKTATPKKKGGKK